MSSIWRHSKHVYLIFSSHSSCQLDTTHLEEQQQSLHISTMLFRNIVRSFHTSRLVHAAEKSNLATLRKKTGYTFANCKKALELHNNDLVKVTCALCR